MSRRKNFPVTTHALRTFLRRLGLPLMCVALFSLLGGQMAIFQVVAWGQMLRDYTRDLTVAEAVEKLFRGDDPCTMCQSIAKEKRKQDTAPATVKVEKKGELFLVVRSVLRMPRERRFSYGTPTDFAFPAFFPAPPAPVPRVA